TTPHLRALQPRYLNRGIPAAADHAKGALHRHQVLRLLAGRVLPRQRAAGRSQGQRRRQAEEGRRRQVEGYVFFERGLMRRLQFALGVCLVLVPAFRAAEPDAKEKSALQVTVNTDAAPDLAGWGDKAKVLVEKWHPNVTELLASEGFTP